MDITRSTARLRDWRISQGLSIHEVSDLTGVSAPMLSRVERGERRASPELRVKIARRLGVPIRHLFDVEPLADEEAS